MDDEKFNALQNKFNEINLNLVNIYNNITNRQIRLEKMLGFTDASLPFEPYYMRNVKLSGDYPEIFNKYGEPMEMFFMSDREIADRPNTKGSRYIIWDRYNYGLKTHFYTHDEIFRIVGEPERRFGALIEPPSIKPRSYESVLQNKDYVEKNFEAIFTHDAQILQNISNAKLAFFSASVWYPQQKMAEDAYKRKTKNISMICSAKEFCPMHLLRKNIAFRLKKWGGADTFGKFDGGEYVPIDVPFEAYRYSVAVENYISPYYFTEKVMNCFAAETIPVYIGATEIGKYFNPDGIIQIGVEDANNIENILSKCTAEEYERRLPAVVENYWRVKKFTTLGVFDKIYLEYIKPLR